MPMTKYIIITPARDEEANLECTINSVINQTTRPVQWIIVNDGSQDNTGLIIDHYAKLYPWIIACHRSNRGYRQAGGGVVNAFYDGYAQISVLKWDFLVKLDSDLSFDEGYFDACFNEFAKDCSLGIGGGGIYHEEEGRLRIEENPQFHVRGATKIYRRACWEELGGLIRAPGWDTVDELKANMLGWSTRTFPDLQVTHYRYTGAADGVWKDCLKNGRANYITGYHPMFMLFKCLHRLTRRPYLIGSLGLLLGFLGGYWNHEPQVEDHTLIRYIRNQQVRRLLLLNSMWK